MELTELWKHLSDLAKWQQKAVGHWVTMLSFSGYRPFGFQLAPTNLVQRINPWNVSLFQMISETKADARTEVEILTRVAGYGSQLGTLVDALIAVIPKGEKREQLDEQSLYALLKLEDLARDIRRIKEGDAG